MPTIHVSDKVWEEIEERREGSEPPTNVLEKMFDRENSEIESIVEAKIADMVVAEALE